jgi:hypothetical protein
MSMRGNAGNPVSSAATVLYLTFIWVSENVDMYE